jgi:hypothetical protein
LPNNYDPHGVDQGTFPPLEYALDRTKADDQAVKEGLLIVEADDYTLQLDFDSEEQWDAFINFRLGHLLTFKVVARVWWTASKSGNKHVYVKLLTPLDVTERIALQAAMGSDPTREFLNLMRVHNDTDKPVLLFEKPDVVEIVVYATDGYQPQSTAGPEVKLLGVRQHHMVISQ